MGLDQYVYFVTKSEVVGGEDIHSKDEVAYWRKHNALHGWMENLYREKGGEDDFNCEYLELTAEDLAALRVAVEGNDLPETSGFFFGNDSRFDDGNKRTTLEFLDNAERFLREEENGRVLYFSWW